MGEIENAPYRGILTMQNYPKPGGSNLNRGGAETQGKRRGKR